MRTTTLAILFVLSLGFTANADCPNGQCVVRDAAGRLVSTVQQTASTGRYIVKSSTGRIVQTIQVRGNQLIVRPVAKIVKK